MTRDRILVRRALTHHWRPLAGVALLVALIFGAFTAVNLVQDSAAQAVADSVRASYGKQQFVVQIRDQDALPALRGIAGLSPVADARSAVTHDGRLVDADLRLVEGAGLALGALSSGRTPAVAGEAAVSPAVAQALHLRLGDELSADRGGRDATFSVVGTVVDPADADASLVTAVVADIPAEQATLWLADRDPFDDPRLDDAFQSQLINARTVELLAADEEAAAHGRTFVHGDVAQAGLAIGLVWCLLLVLPALRHLAHPGVVGLKAAGMSTARVERLTLTCLGVVLASGLVGGYVLAVVAGHVFAGPVAGALGQRWLSVMVPVVRPVLLGFGVMALAIAVPLLAARGRGSGLRVPMRRLAELNVAAPAALLAVIAAALSVPLTLQRVIDFRAALLVIAGAALGSPVLIAFAARETTRLQATRQALRSMSANVLVLAILLAGVTGVTSAYAARAVHDDRMMQAVGGLAQPTGSLAVYQLPTTQARELETLYRELGGQAHREWILPDESETYLRVTQASLLECMQEKRIPDPFDALEPCGATVTDGDSRAADAQIDIVALDPRASAPMTGAPHTVEHSSIGIIEYDYTSGQVIGLATADDVEVDPLLGGNMPGVVIPVDGPVAREFGVRPSDSSLVLFEDFGSLSPDVQAEFRGAVVRLAGAAQIAEENPRLQGVNTRVAMVVGIGTAAFVTMLVWFGAGLVGRSSAALSLALHSLGIPRRRRVVFTIRLFLPLAAAGAVGGMWGLVAAWLVGAKDGLGFGWPWWSGPCAAVVTACVAGLRWSASSPRTAADQVPGPRATPDRSSPSVRLDDRMESMS